MPEGPELHLSSKFVNIVCKGRIFSGKIVKSDVSKHANIEWDGNDYRIAATSRGKELKLTLTEVKGDETDDKNKNPRKCLDILFNFGMSGKFDFYQADQLKKHAHLNFFTKDEPKMVLSFVDYRRFGKWQVRADWSKDRGPCILFEYQKFRENVLNNLSDSAFNKPICEALLNQKFFNGLGNYLRAEILYRAGIPPFVSARSVLEPLLDDGSTDVKIKREAPDILQLCNILPLEVVNLGGTGYDPEGRDPDYSKFSEWLQCYYNPNMKNMADHNKRTIWYHGNPGPMVPKETKVRGIKRSSKVAKNKDSKKLKSEDSEDQEYTEKKSKKITRKVLKEAEDANGEDTGAKKTTKRSKKPASDTAKVSKIALKQLKSTPKQNKTRKRVGSSVGLDTPYTVNGKNISSRGKRGKRKSESKLKNSVEKSRKKKTDVEMNGKLNDRPKSQRGKVLF
ncbi:hypothetical protein FSP39_008221 [Pinctada imbricata]|uniref:Formamidopyrimidine-DNA glycosylase catalytic domain-containing protein n=1 Tax=Pinctada imbricata TaxID=66713 RepID=A0AA88Y443_PINIB|nr:hypothetical protein FSP39_008221 [Pinctada imbricata]